MRPVFQTRFGYPHGNCWEACLASILEVPLEEIPDHRPEGERATYVELGEYLMRRHRRALLYFSFRDCGAVPISLRGRSYILGGSAANGLAHAVVARAGRIVHNPNPYPGAHLVAVDQLEFLVSVHAAPLLPYAPCPTPAEMRKVMAEREGGR